ncbi:MaoC family domain-containing protein [Cardiosporidium cionae]|uniref:MaoC family domain-containing protein n=1 Tax=Cardiosporidium cionae TaxID=476202 RepID=A0ABQ7J3Q0_9APIC|nr:MaoC family domain-containing protein [Cardiosporidium cionae]|eukprot:KAF8817711.1 MaoC family domain-containing protein [Cardiosporidium cionae]
MEKSGKIVPSKCVGYKLYEDGFKYTSRDTILYALGIGVSQDPMDQKDLAYTYENSEGFQTVPSFGTVLGKFDRLFEALLQTPGIPEFNPMMLLHGEQKIILHQPLKTDASVINSCRIKNVYDKRTGALIVLEINTTDAQTKELLCTNESSVFIRGLGNFGGDPGQSIRSTRPSTSPDLQIIVKTNENQAILYRLSGDFNPLHIDPDMSQLGGFERPILHGLCTFGIATHGIIKACLNGNSDQVHSISARFSSAVIPGDELRINVWKNHSSIIPFEVERVANGAKCLTNGVLTVRKTSLIPQQSRL